MASKVNAKLCVVLLGALLLPHLVTSSAQSLGEVARQVRKEREALEKKGEVPVRVFTNDDIARMPPIPIVESSHEGEAKLTAPSQQAGAPGGEPASLPAPAQARKAKGEEREELKEYWQARFRTARGALAHAKDEQTLVEDELRLLQIQQARELDPTRSRKLNGQIDASAIELEVRRAAMEKTRQDMEKLKEEFKNSGAPEDWVQMKDSPGQ
ncbi:MAG: hypothetical protein EPN47_01220 [Acidobacteria bacterium]|nr:MAG: hypothetical protein EPN47_01220 [Acidobacteriota bacterium]